MALVGANLVNLRDDRAVNSVPRGGGAKLDVGELVDLRDLLLGTGELILFLTSGVDDAGVEFLGEVGVLALEDRH